MATEFGLRVHKMMTFYDQSGVAYTIPLNGAQRAVEEHTPDYLLLDGEGSLVFVNLATISTLQVDLD